MLPGDANFFKIKHNYCRQEEERKTKKIIIELERVHSCLIEKY